MNPFFVAISFAAGGLATVAFHQLVRPVLAGRMVWPALVTAALATVVTTAIGTAAGVARIDFLLGVSAFTPVVLVLLEAAAARGEDVPTPTRVLDHLVAPVYFRALFGLPAPSIEVLVELLLERLIAPTRAQAAPSGLG